MYKKISEKIIADRTKVKNEILDETEKQEWDINNELFKYYFNDYQSPSNLYNKLRQKAQK